VVVASGTLAVGVVTLVVAVLILGSARRSEQTGEERLEMLREQRERLELLNAERRLLQEELKNQRQATPDGSRSTPRLEEESDRRVESTERPERSESWFDARRPQEGTERSWWRRVFGGRA
jgi:hypothetical protein